MKLLNKIGVLLALLYLGAAMQVGPKFGIYDTDKDKAISSISSAKDVQSAANIGRFYLGLMMNTINTAKSGLSISCAVVLFYGSICGLNWIKANRAVKKEKTASTAAAE